MDDGRLKQQQAQTHKLRRAILGVLRFAEGCTLQELAETMPDAAAAVVPRTSPEKVIAYHLRVLREAHLVGCNGGVYRALAG
ncbi:MAG TPA: helix-turn-helix domain-containing protein [Solirubrobacterales bacterium]|nr:helix-turn-helix domain-containing protein [Solirubrobacterales bacterium]